MFKNFYIEKNGKSEDILNNGKLSCAYFVSTILKQFNLIEEVHTTIEGTLDGMMQTKDWIEVNMTDIQAGDIIIWEKNGKHSHMGFALGKEQAISNSSSKCHPVKHHIDFDEKRQIQIIYRYTNWENEDI